MMKRQNKKGYLKAFTLTEMLMVLAIIGILLMLVLPNQASTVAQAKAIEAQQNLNHVYALQKNHFFMHSKYSASLDEIGFEQLALVTDGGQAKYKISIVEASATSFQAQAEAVVDFDGDGEFNIWTIDQNQLLKEVNRD
ncbi:MAG: type II secretion system GspH family protein [Flavobacteriales bacterium]|nr:type II secretion system GspH family protein [Flavobacteriales bacterium]